MNRIGHVNLASWQEALFQVLREMEEADDPRGDDVEALVRVAWKLLGDRQRFEEQHADLRNAQPGSSRPSRGKARYAGI
jgi:hypothetical protein